MSCLFRFLTISLLFAVPGCAEGHEINRMDGVDMALGEFSGAPDDLAVSDDYRVDATTSAGARVAPLRFSAALTPIIASEAKPSGAVRKSASA
jgi:hypothetical protein